MRRLSSSAGIAIGPILFMLAILGILATIMSSGSSSFGTAGQADRIVSEVGNQAVLIRTKLNECVMQYITNGVNNSAAPCAGDSFPCSDQTNGTLVRSLTCPGDPLDGGGAQRNVWTGLRVTDLPPPSSGFAEWYYMNAGDAGGRCIWIEKAAAGSPSAAMKAGMASVVSKMTSQEVAYQPDSNSQKMVIFITRPSGAAHSKCTVP